MQGCGMPALHCPDPHLSQCRKNMFVEEQPILRDGRCLAGHHRMGAHITLGQIRHRGLGRRCPYLC